MDKRGKAQVHLEDALRELSKALSLLGGKTRNKPKDWPPPYKYIARQYLESIITRLRVTQLVLARREWLPTAKQEEMIADYEPTRSDRD